MAENEQGQEKTEEATAKRIEDARSKGQVPRSREFNTFFMMIVSGAALVGLGPGIIRDLLGILHDSLTPSRAEVFDKKFMINNFLDQVMNALSMLAPLFILLVFVAIASSLTIGGWNFSIQAIAPKFSKLNPLSGVKRIVGVQGLVELTKALFKFFIVATIAVILLMQNADSLLLVGRQDVEVALANIGNELVWYFLLLSSSLLIVAAMDAPYQLWNNKRQMRMSKDEVKQEHKNQEGSPETKGRIRRTQQEMAMKRMMAEVPEADVVITNPTHFAVALKYDQERSGAPIVVAKGADLVAAKIRNLATKHHVPILSSPALARAIYFSTELDHEIPAGLYLAVAKVLAFVFQLKDKPGTDLSSPITFDDVEIPDDLRRDN
ncbi:MAG: flagellar biosynthesis protein FlhB [Gammaproteobacteria bacterium]|nr:flagellar biosynthesis protein FlhB [Gammaproteobacteria bacterium]